MANEQILKALKRSVKINYLKGMNLFKEDQLKEMDNAEINNLIKTALEVKGY